jgi:hypothetical protein
MLRQHHFLRGKMVGMPKFSLGDLLWSLSLLAAGFGLMAIGIRGIGSPQALGVYLSLPCMGAAIGVLFQNRTTGIIWGCSVTVLLFVAMAGVLPILMMKFYDADTAFPDLPAWPQARPPRISPPPAHKIHPLPPNQQD